MSITKSKVVLFWSTFDADVDSSFGLWRDKKIELSPFHYLPLLSHVRLRNNVTLYTYQNIEASYEQENIFEGIELRDADEVFPARYAYVALTNGHSIAHVSDAVRLKVASVCNGIVLDSDAVALREFPLSDESGWFASMPAKATGGFAPQWGKAHPPLTIHDMSWNGRALSAFPIKVNEITKGAIEKLSNKIMVNLARTPSGSSKGWNYILWTIKDIVKMDSRLKTYEPVTFCPVPSWLLAGKCYSLESPTRLNGDTVLFGYRLPTIDAIMNNSITIQHFFESAFQDASRVGCDFWDSVNGDSLVGIEADFILGSNWRQILREYVR